ncbi:LysR family transcriptional regulator [Streptomyces noursei ZPM]|nr:LysR family transcriptional regulator [Streptomyces noursei]AKA01961.1 LysR family transcriptional regulator [Streptomyces noursei ZPM]EOT03526.1 LysR family transcriptional regulator [Streptomyces noursei CCRC 11814]EXU92741.1 LysR family transcriptional regulator [Streptomyces noursei PD-1]UWS70425.1 LysR family transcriptional regulator [Streptomyces noursei]
MDFTDVSLTALRVFRAVAEEGTFTAAAASLGYTQSAVSRQIAAIERAAGAELLERRREGVRLTSAGRVVLRRATVVLDEIAETARELSGLPVEGGTVRLGWVPTAGTTLVPHAVAALRRSDPGVRVVSREGGTPALVRALRAGSIDLALLSSAPPFRAPDTESPLLAVQTLTERALCLAVPAAHPLARGDFVDAADLRGQRWIAGSASGADRLMGVWPGLDERPEIAHTARDWLAKLHLVAAGCALTTVPCALAPAAPPGVRILPVRGGPQETRRLLLARLPGTPPEPVRRLAAALRAAALATDTAPDP